MKFDFFFVLFLWCIYKRMKFFIKFGFWIWMKMHVSIHKIWFFLYCLKNAWKFDWIWISDFNENACLSAWNLIFYSFWRMDILMLETLWNFFWMKMHALINWFLFVFLILFFFFWKMHLWMREVLWIFWMKMHAWMHELFLPFWYCSFF